MTPCSTSTILAIKFWQKYKKSPSLNIKVVSTLPQVTEQHWSKGGGKIKCLIFYDSATIYLWPALSEREQENRNVKEADWIKWKDNKENIWEIPDNYTENNEQTDNASQCSGAITIFLPNEFLWITCI